MEYLAVTLLGAEQPTLINELSKLANSCNCNIIESRFTMLGADFVANLLLVGTWNAVAKFEASLASFENKHEIRCLSRRTHLREAHVDNLPYTAYIIAPNKAGTLYKITQFFNEQSLHIYDMNITTYAAPATETPMYSITLTFTISAKRLIADIRETFMIFCDEYNFDAVMEPQKS